MTPAALPEIEQELADVLIYLVRLADRLDVDLLGAVERKMAINALRFSAARAGNVATSIRRLLRR
ncbi:MAG: hypothetical protein MZW92_21875 [Comamonadaceae bacterium]|nr:hypothetical protein [Comamonadaceae bacterium]